MPTVRYSLALFLLGILCLVGCGQGLQFKDMSGGYEVWFPSQEVLTDSDDDDPLNAKRRRAEIDRHNIFSVTYWDSPDSGKPAADRLRAAHQIALAKLRAQPGSVTDIKLGDVSGIAFSGRLADGTHATTRIYAGVKPARIYQLTAIVADADRRPEMVAKFLDSFRLLKEAQ